jgi:hypothetical protein
LRRPPSGVDGAENVTTVHLLEGDLDVLETDLFGEELVQGTPGILRVPTGHGDRENAPGRSRW